MDAQLINGTEQILLQPFVLMKLCFVAPFKLYNNPGFFPLEKIHLFLLCLPSSPYPESQHLFTTTQLRSLCNESNYFEKCLKCVSLLCKFLFFKETEISFISGIKLS